MIRGILSDRFQCKQDIAFLFQMTYLEVLYFKSEIKYGNLKKTAVLLANKHQKKCYKRFFVNIFFM